MANYIDSAFQLGMMLGNAYGNMWAANAKKRQGAKADDIINEMKNQQEIERIANMRSAPAENAAQAVVNDNAQRQAAQAAGQITGLGNIGVNKGVDYMGMGAQFAEPQDPFKLSVPSAIDALKSPLGKERALNNAMQATAKDYQQQASLTPEQRKASNWNPNYTEDNVRNRLKQAGINKEVIDEKMGDVKNDIAQRARDVLLPSIMQNLYGTVDEKGNYKAPTPMDSMKAMIDLQTLAQYDPATAKMLSTGVISPKEYLNIQTAKDKAAQDFQNKLTLASILEASKTARSTARGGSGSRGGYTYYGSNGGIKLGDYTNANKRLDEIRSNINAQFGLDPSSSTYNEDFVRAMKSVPQSTKNEYATLLQFTNRFSGGAGPYYSPQQESDYNQQGENASPKANLGNQVEAILASVDDWDNYNETLGASGAFQQVIDLLRSNQVPESQIQDIVLGTAKKQYGEGSPYYEALAASMGVETEAEKRKRFQETLNPPEYNRGNTTGETWSALGNFFSKIVNGEPITNLAHR